MTNKPLKMKNELPKKSQLNNRMINSNRIQTRLKDFNEPDIQLRKRFNWFYCWTCGLGQGDAQLCTRCPIRNNVSKEIKA